MAIAIKAEFGTFDLADLSDPIPKPDDQTLHPSEGQTSQGSNMGDLRPLLNDRERGRLDELFVASRALVEPMEHERDVSNCLVHTELKFYILFKNFFFKMGGYFEMGDFLWIFFLIGDFFFQNGDFFKMRDFFYKMADSRNKFALRKNRA